ncbi:MAG: periplasmic heavy metal sensor [Rhizomicrobium sp.]|jgi:uncharacterized membrane protein
MSNGSPQRKSNLVLIVSLCVNLILVGVIAMGVFRVFHHGPMFGGGHGFGRGELAPHALTHLVPAETDKIKNVVAAHRDRILLLRSDAMAARQDVQRIFAAPDFNQKAFDQSLERVGAADAALEAEEMKVVSESVATLAPDERRADAEWAMAHRGFGMHHRGEGHGF